MSRLIDADKFKQEISAMAIKNNYPVRKANALCEIIDRQPTVDAEPVRRGKWERVKEKVYTLQMNIQRLK